MLLLGFPHLLHIAQGLRVPALLQVLQEKAGGAHTGPGPLTTGHLPSPVATGKGPLRAALPAAFRPPGPAPKNATRSLPPPPRPAATETHCHGRRTAAGPGEPAPPGPLARLPASPSPGRYPQPRGRPSASLRPARLPPDRDRDRAAPHQVASPHGGGRPNASPAATGPLPASSPRVDDGACSARRAS